MNITTGRPLNLLWMMLTLCSALFYGVATRASVTLVSFTASSGNGSINLRWETETEPEANGFNVWRTANNADVFDAIPEPELSQLNEYLIPAQGSLSTGALYEFIDSNVNLGETYYYWLEEIELDGDELHFGPASAALDDSAELGGGTGGEATASPTASASTATPVIVETEPQRNQAPATTTTSPTRFPTVTPLSLGIDETPATPIEPAVATSTRAAPDMPTIPTAMPQPTDSSVATGLVVDAIVAPAEARIPSIENEPEPAALTLEADTVEHGDGPDTSVSPDAGHGVLSTDSPVNGQLPAPTDGRSAVELPPANDAERSEATALTSADRFRRGVPLALFAAGFGLLLAFVAVWRRKRT